MVHDRFYSFLGHNNAFHNYKFGFRNNHSTNHALIGITKYGICPVQQRHA